MRSRKPFMIVCAAAAAAKRIVLAAVKFSDADQKDPGLKTVYRDSFDVGCAVTVPVLSVPKLADLIKKQFNVITLENELKPDSVLDIEESRRCIPWASLKATPQPQSSGKGYPPLLGFTNRQSGSIPSLRI